MHVRIGVLGLGLVSALVVGGIAGPPVEYGNPYPAAEYPVADGYGDAAGFPGVAVMPDVSGQVGVPGPPGATGFSSGTGLPNGTGFPGATGTPGVGPMGPPPNRPSGGSQIANSGIVTAETAPEVASAGEIIGFNGFNGSGSQTITLVHTGKMQIAVYHIDRSGQLTLVSSRPIEDDFSFSFNVNAPLPREIRLLGGQVK